MTELAAWVEALAAHLDHVDDKAEQWVAAVQARISTAPDSEDMAEVSASLQYLDILHQELAEVSRALRALADSRRSDSGLPPLPRRDIDAADASGAGLHVELF